MKKKLMPRVCIVGAGAAGLSAARFLEKKGYSRVTVLERNDYVGGMCYSEKIYGQATGMGAIVITPDYRITIGLAGEYGLDLQPGPVNMLLDRETGYQYRMKNIIRGEKPLVLAFSVLRYYCYLLKYRRSFRRPGLKKISRELTQAFHEWLAQKRLTSLENLFLIPITCFGYGYLDSVPAVYVLKYMNFRNFSTLMYLGLADVLNFRPRWTKRLINGLQSLMQAMAEDLSDVRTGITIRSVTRIPGDKDPVRIEYTTGNAKTAQTLACDFLILAIPQEMQNLGFMDLSGEEKSLFGEVVHNNYYTIACEVKDFSENYFLELLKNRKIHLPDDGFPFMISKVWEESDIAIFYSYSETPMPEKEIIRKLRENIKTTNRKLVKIIEVKKWDYFPHVSGEALRNGFYDKLDRLQGRNNTFYTGGLLNFELVENVMAYSKRLVERFF